MTMTKAELFDQARSLLVISEGERARSDNADMPRGAGLLDIMAAVRMARDAAVHAVRVPYVDLCQESAYGTTVRLSRQIRVF